MSSIFSRAQCTAACKARRQIEREGKRGEFSPRGLPQLALFSFANILRSRKYPTASDKKQTHHVQAPRGSWFYWPALLRFCAVRPVFSFSPVLCRPCQVFPVTTERRHDHRRLYSPLFPLRGTFGSLLHRTYWDFKKKRRALCTTPWAFLLSEP